MLVELVQTLQNLDFRGSPQQRQRQVVERSLHVERRREAPATPEPAQHPELVLDGLRVTEAVPDVRVIASRIFISLRMHRLCRAGSLLSSTGDQSIARPAGIGCMPLRRSHRRPGAPP